MSEINVRDSLYNAIKEYNSVIARPQHIKATDAERTGMFYTTLRRHLNLGGKNAWRVYGTVWVDDLECKFYPNGELMSLRIHKRFPDELNYDFNVNDHMELTSLQHLKSIANAKPVFYRTP